MFKKGKLTRDPKVFQLEDISNDPIFLFASERHFLKLSIGSRQMTKETLMIELT